MRILWVTTKSPWPPSDGSRLLILHTLAALHQVGHDITLVCPTPEVLADFSLAHDALAAICEPHLIALKPTNRITRWVRSLTERKPFSIAQQDFTELQLAVHELLQKKSFDIVHAEPIQAFHACAAALEKGIPLALRCHYIESDLWHSAANFAKSSSAFLKFEAKRLERFEAEVVSACNVVVALTHRDAEILDRLSLGKASIEVIPVAFPSKLSPGSARLEGNPAVALFSRRDWYPMQDGALWFEKRLWPSIKKQLPEAQLHKIRSIPAPGTVMAVPLRISSGINVKIFEAWARGIPVVATHEAASGLDAKDGEHLRIAETSEAFADALSALAKEPVAMIRASQKLLREKHSPGIVAKLLTLLYARVQSAHPRTLA